MVETITLVITAATLNTIGAALQELPYKVALPAITEINSQVQAHIADKKAKVEVSPG
jgi:hypothetical protein